MPSPPATPALRRTRDQAAARVSGAMALARSEARRRHPRRRAGAWVGEGRPRSPLLVTGFAPPFVAAPPGGNPLCGEAGSLVSWELVVLMARR